MPITATGLGSGLDVESLVAQLVLAEVQPAEQRINVSEAAYQSKLSAYGLVRGALDEFNSSVNLVSNLSNFTAKSATVSQPEAVSVTAGAEAVPANYNIDVDSLAKSQVLVSAGSLNFTAVTDAVGEGTLSFQSLADGASSVDVTIDSTNNSLAGLSDAINAADAGVTASIINDGSGYRLIMTSDDTGLANRVDVAVTEAVDDGEALTGLSAFSYSSSTASGNLVETQSAQDALVRINNLSVSSSSNLISSAITGLNITLKAVTASSTSIDVVRNTELATSAVSSFVREYNELMQSIEAVSGYDADQQVGQALTGDSTIRSIATALRAQINSQISNVGGNYSSLAELGISTDVISGELVIDATTLNAVLAAEPLDVANVFTNLGRPTNSSVGFVSSSSATVPGDYAIDFSQTLTSGVLTTDAITTTGNNGGETLVFTIVVDNQSVNVNLDTDDEAEVPAAGGNPTLDEVRAAIENAINASLSGGRSISVTTDGTPAFVFTSGATGDGSTVDITAQSSSSDRFGLAVRNGTDGTATTLATIGGIAAIYDSETNQISGAEGSTSDGLVLKLLGGATGSLGTVKYAVGIAEGISDLLSGFLSSQGLIDSRVTGIEASISDLDEQREALNFRADGLERQYRNQFNGLETLIAQFSATQTFLSQALQNFVAPMSFVKK